jgi:drug/metabolite transporter (DMT)-like permease
VPSPARPPEAAAAATAVADRAAPRTFTRPVDDAGTWGNFLLLSAIWGSSFLFTRTALQDGVEPLTLVSLRAGFGALFLVGVLLVARQTLPRGRAVWLRLAFLGVFNVAVPFTLIAWAQQSIPSGVASILNAMVPISTMLLAAIALHDEPITPARLGGLALGFSGVVLLAAPELEASDAEQAVLVVASMLAVLAAGVCYATSSVFTRRQLNRVALVRTADGQLRPPTALEIALGSSAVACLVIVPLALLLERPSDGLLALPESGVGWFAVAWLGMLGTGVAYLLHFRLIERWGPTRASLVTYVIPVVAVVLGFTLLDERLRPIELVGAVLIIGGVVLVNGSVGQRPLFRGAGRMRSTL